MTSQRWSHQNCFRLLAKLYLIFMLALKSKFVFRYHLFSTFTKLWHLGPTTFSEKRMTHLLALISQSDDKTPTFFLDAYLKPQHDTNQCHFLPLSWTIFSKLPSLRQRFSKGRLSFCFLFQEGFLKSILRDAQVTHTKLYSHWIEEVCSSLASLKGLKGKKTKFSWLVDRNKAKPGPALNDCINGSYSNC